MFNAAIANGAGVDLTAAEKIKLEDELLLSSLETDKTKFAEFFNEVENLGREVRRTCEYYLINKRMQDLRIWFWQAAVQIWPDCPNF